MQQSQPQCNTLHTKTFHIIQLLPKGTQCYTFCTAPVQRVAGRHAGPPSAVDTEVNVGRQGI